MIKPWTIVESPANYQRALQLTKGSYQKAIIEGNHSVIGSTLVGKMKKYRRNYSHSIVNLLQRMIDKNISFSINGDGQLIIKERE